MSENGTMDGNGFDLENGLNFLDAPDETEESQYKVCIKVVGVGGAGGNAINNMIRAGLDGVEYYHINTDYKDLKKSLAPNKIPIGKKLTNGHGTGGDPSIGQKAALESGNEIVAALEGADIVFIAAGMGGGTGTGAAPVIAGLSENLNATTIAVVTKPYAWEGPKKAKRAEEGILQLIKQSASLVVIPNDNLKACLPENYSIIEAFKAADDVIRHAVQGIANLINEEGIIHRDFADVKAVIKKGSRAILGIGKAKGEERALEAVKMAANNPLLEFTSMKNVDRVLLVFSGSVPSNKEMDIATNYIRSLTSEDCEISWGTYGEDPNSDELCITVIAASSSKEELNIGETIPRINNMIEKKISPNGLNDSVTFDDVKDAIDDTPNKTLIRKGTNILFDKTPTPSNQSKKAYLLKEQTPTKLRKEEDFNTIDSTPAILRKKQV